MGFETEYRAKLRSAAQAVQVVKSGDVVDYGFFNGKPVACDQTLAARSDELSDVHVYTAVSLPPVPEVLGSPQAFIYFDMQYSHLTRLVAKQNPRVFYLPIIYHMAPRLMREQAGTKRDVGIYRVCPMDQHGYFNLGPQNSEARARMSVDRVVILEVNQNLPVCLGGAEESVHISEVDMVVEAPPDQKPFYSQASPAGPEEEVIAAELMPFIHDGSCVQLGIGSLPDHVGRLIAQSDLKDLGGHTEMFCDSYVQMIESGRMTGARKNFDRGRVAYTFAIGSQRTYDFLDRNPAAASYPVDYTNDPRVIARQDNFISICNAVQVDLYSQVNAESYGSHQLSGNGGLWDFVLGAQWSQGGKSFICLTSTFTDHQGERHSRIVPTFRPGSITTIPRQMVDYLVTEYGVARMHGLSTWKRAEALIGLAHPDYREELTHAACQLGIWCQSNKRG